MTRTQRRTGLCLVAALTLSALLSGCGGGTTGSASASGGSQTAAVSGAQSAEPAVDRAAEANTLLGDLTGTYEELWPVMLQPQYDETWLDACTQVVGADQAAAAVKTLKAACAGTVTGQAAVDAYPNQEGAAFNCDFTEGVAQITFDGSTISGVDESGTEVFSHSYHYVGYAEEVGFYQFQSDDENAGAFTYFALAPDTPAATYHIEFRYGDDLTQLSQYYTGKYAYWMAAGVLRDCDAEMVKNGITLFCTENLSQ